VTLSTFYSELRFNVAFLSHNLTESEGAAMTSHADLDSFVNQEAVVAEAHLTHLEVLLVAPAPACHLSDGLGITFADSLLNSGEAIMLSMLMLLCGGIGAILIAALIFSIVFVSGHLGWSVLLSCGYSSVIVNLVN
jgi:hypothetical protein